MLTPLHGGVPSGVYVMVCKMQAKGLALETKEASLWLHVFC